MKPAQTQPQSRAARPSASDSAGSQPSLILRLATGMLAVVTVCRLLTPTDAAMSGETLWIAQFTLMAFLVWAFAAWRSDETRWRCDWLDASVLLLCLGHVIGALVLIFTAGDKRAATTMLWEWVGLLVTCFLMRRMLLQLGTRQNLVLAVASAAAVLAGLGIWQHHFGFSESRRKYEELKAREETLQQAGRPLDAAAALDWERSLAGVRSDFMQMNVPADDAARMMFEQRLYSVEPIALFALANTLAGILIFAVIVWLGLIIENGLRVSRPILVAGTVVTLLLIYCLLLTKSRTAYVGLIAGLAVYGIRSGLMGANSVLKKGTVPLNSIDLPQEIGSSERDSPLFQRPARSLPWLRWRLPVGATALALLIAIAYASGGLDRFVVSESAKSLRYRFEYWTATWRMLEKTSRNLVLGVGPGNFRQNYLEFKLPQSSEEIADPHNLVLDVWANGGLIGLVGLAGVCFCCVRPLWEPLEYRLKAAVKLDERGTSTPPKCGVPTPPQPPKGGTPTGTPTTPTWSDGVILGGVAGFLIVLFVGFVDEITVVLLLPLWLLIVLVCRPIFQHDVPRVVAAAAGVALIMHLLGAGGIGMPAVSQVLLLAAVLAFPEPRPSGSGVAQPLPDGRGSAGECLIGDRQNRELPFPPLAMGVIGLALYLACWFTGLMPLVTVNSLLASAKQAMYQRGRPSQAERDFRTAAEFDPWSATACEHLSQMALQSWLAAEGDRSAVFERCLHWQMMAIERDPRNSGGYRFLGEIYLSKATREGDTGSANAAADAFQRAVALYPNHAVLQSQLAEALWQAGKASAAREAASHARDLDRINEQAGHTDKRLPEARRRLIDKILSRDSN